MKYKSSLQAKREGVYLMNNVGKGGETGIFLTSSRIAFCDNLPLSVMSLNSTILSDLAISNPKERVRNENILFIAVLFIIQTITNYLNVQQ